MIRRINMGGSPNLGVALSVTDKVVIAPQNIQDGMVDLIMECLDVPVIKTPVSGSNLPGALTCGNSNGFIVSKYAFDSEIEAIKASGVEVERIPDRLTAVGNIVLANDFGALVNPLLSDKSVKLIADVLDVEVQRGTIANFKITGSVAAATNKGALVHPSTTQEEMEVIEKVLNVPADVGTVNSGTRLVGACTAANSNGVIVGLNTTGPELARIEEAFGFLEGYL
ncbi:translation initiation factor IF-6 [Methanobacterium aggregans]|uniref:translation initiation factor IF-6 n=1 Tax=Methanobacterium aggregans TaxID=1615586 RepID=UPI001AE30CAF|nr:translation initiation factor IF-6 [Methanobacterium aggregans]MBP2046502.1 translation initiation factor 6 [Methanobacterium aggregans]